MPVVVEEPVVRMQRLRVDTVRKLRGQAGAPHVAAVVADVDRVELANPPVLARAAGIHRHVAEEHREAPARLAHRLAPAREIGGEGVDLPGVPDEVARNAHLREHHDLGIAVTLDALDHARHVPVGAPGRDLHLDEDDPRQGFRLHRPDWPGAAGSPPPIRAEGSYRAGSSSTSPAAPLRSADLAARRFGRSSPDSGLPPSSRRNRPSARRPAPAASCRSSPRRTPGPAGRAVSCVGRGPSRSSGGEGGIRTHVDRNDPNRFRVGAVMTASVPLRTGREGYAGWSARTISDRGAGGRDTRIRGRRGRRWTTVSGSGSGSGRASSARAAGG